MMPKTLLQVAILGMLAAPSVCFAQNSPPPPAKKPSGQPVEVREAVPRRRPRVLTNDDFPSYPSASPAASAPEKPVTESRRSTAAAKDPTRTVLQKRTRELQEKIEVQAAQMATIRTRLEEIKQEDRPVFASEVKPGRPYTTAQGPGGVTVYIPVKTDEEYLLQTRLKNLEIDAQQAALEWEVLLDELRRAGLTVKGALED